MTDNFHTPYSGDVLITDNGVNFNLPLGQLDQQITNMLAGTETFTSGIRVGTGSNEASALLQMNSTTQAYHLPTLTTAERDAIVNPPIGLLIFNSTTKTVDSYTAAGWVILGQAAATIALLLNDTFSADTTITIADIPQTFRHLELRLTIAPDADDAGEEFHLKFNGSATDYAYFDFFFQTGGSVNVGQSVAGIRINRRTMDEKISNAANTQAHFIFNIQHYSSTVLPKYVLSKGIFQHSTETTPRHHLGSGYWEKSPFEAIDEITIINSGGIAMSGKYALYGRN